MSVWEFLGQLLGELLPYLITAAVPTLAAWLGIRVNRRNERVTLQAKIDTLNTQRSNLQTQLDDQAEEFRRDLAAQRQTLEKQIEDQQVIIADLRKQLAALSHFRTLYETLFESHNLLKSDHDQLKADFEALKQAREQARDERKKTQAENDRLKDENHRLFEANKQLTMENKVHKSNWLLLGEMVQEAITDKAAPPPGSDPGEAVAAPPPDVATESSEETKPNDPE